MSASSGAGAGALTAAPSWGARLRGVEGLRALACMLVLAGHAWQHGDVGYSSLGPLREVRIVPNLASGLTLFFTLSGFLLWRPFAASVVADEPLPSVSAYFRNRSLRILPAYWTILALVMVIGIASRPGSFTDTFHMFEPDLVAANVALVQGYQPHTLLTGIGPAWSLTVEVVFYLLLPLFALLAYRLATTRPWRSRIAAALLPAAIMLAVGIGGKVLTAATLREGLPGQHWGSSWHAVLERSFLASADLFAFGMVAAVVFASAAHGRLRVNPAVAGVAALALGLLFAGIQRAAGLGSAYTTLIALVYGLVVLYVVLPRGAPGALVRALESRPVVFIGVISYSIYLWHEPLIFWLRDHGFLTTGSRGLFQDFLVAAGVTVAASAVTFRLVEAPAMRLKAPMSRARSPIAAMRQEAGTSEAAP